MFYCRGFDLWYICDVGVSRQVTQQIMPNINKYSYLYKKWEFLENSINIDGVKRLLGFASPEEGTTQGWQKKYRLNIGKP